MPVQKKLKIHFIGIGGIGVSALAQYYLTKGHQVSGSDLASSEIIESLRKKGAEIVVGPHRKENLPPGVDLVIYSPAVRPDNPELIKNSLSYPQALGELTKQYFTVAVTGTHGKSTTSAMIGLILEKAGLDPTVIVGTKVKEFSDSNCRVGQSKYLVIEADEHFASFLNYWPKIIALTNIEPDHLDFYKNIKKVKQAYREFISHLPPDGRLITAKKIEPGLESVVKLPGQYNLMNATLALKVARALEIPDEVSFKVFSQYQGSWRRFEIREKGRLTIVSDYGHHPTEVKAALRAARDKWPDRKIWCVFQPHQYQRTYYLFKDFVKAFSNAPVDRVFITDIYDVAGREEKEIREKVSAEKLVRTVNKGKAEYLAKDKIIEYLKDNLQGQEVVIFMGAGDIYEVDKKFD